MFTIHRSRFLQLEEPDDGAAPVALRGSRDGPGQGVQGTWQPVMGVTGRIHPFMIMVEMFLQIIYFV